LETSRSWVLSLRRTFVGTESEKGLLAVPDLEKEDLRPNGITREGERRVAPKTSDGDRPIMNSAKRGSKTRQGKGAKTNWARKREERRKLSYLSLGVASSSSMGLAD